MNTPNRFRTDWWQVELPAGWKARAFRCIHAVIFNPEGVGQINVRMGTNRMVHRLMRSRTATRLPYAGKLNGHAWQSVSESTLAQTWLIHCGERNISVTYSCAVHNSDVELDEVNRIVASIKAVE